MSKFSREIFGVDPADPPADDPVEVSGEILSVDEWVADWLEGARARADRWKRRVSRPSRDPIAASIAADAKWWDRLQEAKRLNLRVTKLKKVGFQGWATAIEATTAADYSRGVEKAEWKFRARIADIRDLVNFVKQTIAKMPDATDADREKRITAARKCMLVVGRYAKGQITAEEARREILSICGVRA